MEPTLELATVIKPEPALMGIIDEISLRTDSNMDTLAGF
jgi:hypothetical protein